jgi:hypothetical protein
MDKTRRDDKTTVYSFNDSLEQVVIVEGGEQIVPNTYGFEVEFCSHDNSVFMFTHVDVMAVATTITGIEGTDGDHRDEWKIETDSGGVLELVTKPIGFNTVKAAYDFKEDLARSLAKSVDQPNKRVLRDIKAVLLQHWRDNIGICLRETFQGRVRFEQFRVKDWHEVGDQLNPNNVYDGINIPAALMRHQINSAAWDTYVYDTVLSRSEKDWGRSYSSQVNMPMTLAGYFLYSRKKYEDSQVRYQNIKDKRFPESWTDSTLQKNVETWYWRSVVWKVFKRYADQACGHGVLEKEREWNLRQVNALGLLYVMTSKILTGALGSLSEPNQLKLQFYAWNMQSTQSYATGSPVEERKLRSLLGPVNMNWLEFHSSLKDLTGLWFKASLFETIDRESPAKDWMDQAARVLNGDKGNNWKIVSDEYKRIMEDDKWEELYDDRENFSEGLEELDWTALIEKIKEVEAALARYLVLPVIEQKWRALPEKRAFLDYEHAPPWEGRFDTMYSPITRVGNSWLYLVEHRFN